MNGVCEAAHFPQILIPAAIGFLLGFLIGRLYAKVKENSMGTTSTTPLRTRLSYWYDRLTPILVIACLLTSTYAAVSTYHQQGVNHAQQVQRDKDQAARTADLAALVKCVNKFATDLSDSLPPVRVASAKRDEALLDALIGDKGLGGLLVRTQKGTKGDPKTELANLITTFDALKVAANHLVKVRTANPYPQPPSKICDLP